MKKVSLLLHDIRSAHNVGSIFRTADAAGVEHIYLTGITPAPVDRFGRQQKDIAKTALGAQTFIPWTYAKTPGRVMSKLKKEGYLIVGVEQDVRAEPHDGFKVRGPVLFVFGNEVLGLPKRLCDACEVLLEIPMRESLIREPGHPRNTGQGKESLNVSVAAGVVLFSAIKS